MPAFQFVSGAGCRGKAFYTIAVAFGRTSNHSQSGCLACSGYAFKRRDAVVAAENSLNGSTLAVAQVRVVFFEMSADFEADQSRKLVLSSLHNADIFAFQVNHLIGGKFSCWLWRQQKYALSAARRLARLHPRKRLGSYPPQPMVLSRSLN